MNFKKYKEKNKMDLLKFLKNNLYIQNIVSSLSHLLPFLENTISKYIAIKKALYITAHDKTIGNYLEFGALTLAPLFNYAIKANKIIRMYLGKQTVNSQVLIHLKCIEIKEDDNHPFFIG